MTMSTRPFCGLISSIMYTAVPLLAGAQQPIAGVHNPHFMAHHATVAPINPPLQPGMPQTATTGNNGAPQLKPMYIDTKLFKPDKWWTYESYDEDRLPAYSVEQQGKVLIGARAAISSSALVFYRVMPYASSAIAHQEFQKMVSGTRRSRNQHRSERRLAKGDEGVEVLTKVVTDQGLPEEAASETLVRYGRHIVRVFGSSNMKAFGPHPKVGERRWMYQPVYEQVQARVLKRWSEYKRLLASR